MEKKNISVLMYASTRDKLKELAWKEKTNIGDLLDKIVTEYEKEVSRKCM